MLSRFPHLVLALLVLAQVVRVDAQDKEQCAAAYEDAQAAQLEHRLLEARAHLVTCTQVSCPSAVSTDCWRWLAQLEAALPTVVVAARSASGADLVDVRLTLDGAPLEDASSGKAMPVDPGPHTLRAELEGYQPAEQALVVREGEKARLVELVLTPVGGADTGASASAAPERSEPARAHGTRALVLKRAGYSLLGAGLVSAGLGSYFAWVGYGKGKDLRDSCKPECDEGEVDAARTKLIVGNVLVGVGAAALAAGVVTTLLGRARERAPVGEPRRAGRGVDLDVALMRGGGFAGVRARY